MRPLLVATVLVAVACGDAAAPPPSSVPPPVSPVTTAPPSTSPDTSVPVTTVPITTVPATTVPITTVTPTTSSAPLNIGVTVSSECVLGWWDGSWRNAGDIDVAPPVAAGAILQVATFGGTATSTVVELFPFDDIGAPTWSLQTAPELTDGVAISGDWDVVPHQVALSSASAEVYLEQVANILSQRGYPGVPIELAQIIRTDLEGDGVDEVIVAARHPGAPTYDRDVGVFSVVFLRKVIEEEVQTAILHFSVYAEEDIGEATSAEHAVVSAVADLNGDGKMEIALDGSGYEWYWSEAFEYVDDDLGPVSRMVCGGGV